MMEIFMATVGLGPFTMFTPTVDTMSPEPFMPEHPFNVLEQGKQVREHL